MRLGITASRRVGGAVVRNRAKRRIREWFRNSPLRDAAPVDLVVIVRPEGASCSSAVLGAELDDLARQVLGRLESPR
jgi:ribonuclease P protein component